MKQSILVKDSRYAIGFSMLIKKAVDKYKLNTRFVYYLSSKFPFIYPAILIED